MGETKKHTPARGVASREQILRQLTEIGMGRVEEPKPATVGERLKALELLGKCYQLFAAEEEERSTEPFAVHIEVEP